MGRIKKNLSFVDETFNVYNVLSKNENHHFHCRKNPKDPKVLAQLISAYSKIDPGKAQQVSRDLPSVEETAASVDVEALEAAFSSLGPKYMKKAQKTEPSPGP
ncbi:hypothetical protein DPMN_163157 [Dreissena polymorpha]|uniref:Uncharacterized protein n=1 Tax=Dreissena polymorpha TaxID=45954 RepID=A0A9D4IU62_DREPO|nr:hypothetical protein DPMN_163157 [Dreissena polymorpha]